MKYCLKIAVLGYLCLPTAWAAEEWVAVGKTADRFANVYIAKEFSTRNGTFQAIPESYVEFAKGDKTITKDFTVGTFWHQYKTPIRQFGIRFDELIATEILDCEENYFGRLRTIKKLKGKVVWDEIHPDQDIRLIQINGHSIGKMMCAVKDGKAPGTFASWKTPMPGYDPKPSREKIDALIDKYMPPRSGADEEAESH